MQNNDFYLQSDNKTQRNKKQNSAKKECDARNGIASAEHY